MRKYTLGDDNVIVACLRMGLFRTPGHRIATGKFVDYRTNDLVDESRKSAKLRLLVGEKLKELGPIFGATVGDQTAVVEAIVDCVLEGINVPAVDLR